MKIAQEPDRVDQRVVLIVAASAVLVTVAGVLIAWGVLRWSSADLSAHVGQVSARSFSVPKEVSDTEMTLFDSLDGRRPASRLPARLQSYGFVDRDRERVHVPIQHAMQLYLEQQQRGAQGTLSPRERPSEPESLVGVAP